MPRCQYGTSIHKLVWSRVMVPLLSSSLVGIGRKNYASLVCLRLRFVIFASFEMVDFGFLWDLRADEYI